MSNTSFNEKLVAYLTLISGISISAVAVYYSVVGLASIFSAAVIPIIIMGTALEVSKLIASVWLKLNWRIAPIGVRVYLLVAIAVLMVITSIGVFGFLSRAHSDQKISSNAITEQLAIYDQKIQVSKDRIEDIRKTLAQLDQSVDQVMSQSSGERGAYKANIMRKAQAKERAQILAEIDAEQNNINRLVEETIPLQAKLRNAESEVGPIKYIAEFVYGTTDPKMLEHAVTWMIITLIVVFDPLAVVLLLAAQTSFQNFKSREDSGTPESEPRKETPVDTPSEPETVVTNPEIKEQDTPSESVLEKFPYLNKPFTHFGGLTPVVAPANTVASQEDTSNVPAEQVTETAAPAAPVNISQQEYLKAAQEYLRAR